MKASIRKKLFLWVITASLIFVFLSEQGFSAAIAGVFFGNFQTTNSSLRFSTYEERLQDAEDRLAELERRKNQAKNKLEELEDAKKNIQTYIKELDLQLNENTQELFELEAQIKTTNEELAVTRKELKAAKETEAMHYDTMKRRIQYMYENTDTSYFDIFISADGLSDLLNQVEYMYRITEYDNNLLDRYIEAKQEVADREAEQEATLKQLQSMEESAKFQRDTLETLIQEKNQEIERYTKEIGITDETLFEFLDEISDQELSIEQIKEEEKKRLVEIERKRKEEEERIRKEEERLRKEEEERKKKEEEERKNAEQNGGDDSSSDSTSSADEGTSSNSSYSGNSSSGMIWPLPGDYRTYAKFGPRTAPTAGASTYHKGWDIGGNYGAPIVATLSGTVVSAGYSSSSGNYVTISHGNGLNTVYCHASQLLVSSGQQVGQGQQIALVGSTGVSTGPHLHFAVTQGGVYVDPGNYIG